MPEIEDITVNAEVEDYPNLSHLGEFSDTPGPEDRTVDRKETGDHTPGELRYFVAAHSADDTGNPESVEQDHERMEAYSRGEWRMLGIRAVASVRVRGTEQTLKSAGLWGVESDAGDDYIDGVAREELNQLENILADLGLDAPDDLADANWSGTVDA